MEENENLSVDDPAAVDNAAAATSSDEKSLKYQVSDLVEDARKLAEAEIEYYRTKLSVNMAATKTVLMLFGISIALGFTTVVALILGILLILSSYFGPVAATAWLSGTALLLTALLMGMAIKRARKLPLDENEK